MLSEIVLLYTILVSSSSIDQGFDIPNSEGLTEISSLRTEYSKTYRQENGRYVSFYYSSPKAETNDRSTGNYSNGYIENKYYAIGSSDTYDGTSMLVGRSAVLSYQGDTIEFQTAFSLALPSFDPAYEIYGGGFGVTKSSGSLGSLNCYRATNISYDQLNGTSSYSKVFVDSAPISSNLFSFDLDAVFVNAYAANNDDITLVLEGMQNNSVAYLNSITSTSQRPFFYIEYGIDCGNTIAYSTSHDTLYSSANCLGYALLINDWRTLPNISDASSSSLLIDAFKNSIVAEISNETTTVRFLTDYYSSIYPNERRVASRLRIETNRARPTYHCADYHFMWQCSSGGWAEKKGISNTGLLTSPQAPALDSYWGYSGSDIYNSPTIYFALGVIS